MSTEEAAQAYVDAWMTSDPARRRELGEATDIGEVDDAGQIVRIYTMRDEPRT